MDFWYFYSLYLAQIIKFHVFFYPIVCIGDIKNTSREDYSCNQLVWILSLCRTQWTTFDRLVKWPINILSCICIRSTIMKTLIITMTTQKIHKIQQIDILLSKFKTHISALLHIVMVIFAQTKVALQYM